MTNNRLRGSAEPSYVFANGNSTDSIEGSNPVRLNDVKINVKSTFNNVKKLAPTRATPSKITPFNE